MAHDSTVLILNETKRKHNKQCLSINHALECLRSTVLDFFNDELRNRLINAETKLQIYVFHTLSSDLDTTSPRTALAYACTVGMPAILRGQ